MKEAFRLWCLFLFLAVNVTNLYSQGQLKKSNYIYIFDCTKSMINYGILDETLVFLHQDINERIPGNEITIQLFQGNPLETVNFLREDFDDKKWAEIEKLIRDHAQNVTNTNICSAWEEGLRYIDPGKYNYIYLMTDGEDNAHGSNGTAMVCKLIREWCGKYRDSRAYYVELYKGAMNQEILKAIKESCGIIPIHSGDHDHFMAFDQQKITFNTRELEKTARLHSDWSRESPMEVLCSDPYFKVTIDGQKLKEGGIADFKISPKMNLQDFNQAIDHNPEYRFTVKLNTNRKDLKIQNPEIEVVVINKPERIINTEVVEGADLGCAHYYPAFLFSEESNLDTLSIDLNAQFNEEAIHVGSSLSMQVGSDIDGDSYTLLYNGKEVNDKTFTINKDDKQNLLQIIFDRDAQDGDRNFIIKTIKTHQLDRVNQVEPDDFVITLEAEYDIGWNPLKTILFWLCIIIMTLLIIWMCLLKPIARPNFRGIRRITLEDKKDMSYYKNIEAKGYREIVICNKAEKQNVFSKFLGGKVNYEVDGRWDYPIIISPHKNGIHIQVGTKYLVDKHTCKVGESMTINGMERDVKVILTVN